MKIFLAQQNYHIGNFEYNTKKIIQAIHQAEEENADLIVFSELCICGYPPRDFLDFNDFINRCNAAITEIMKHTETIGVIVGAPAINFSGRGKNLFNAAYLLNGGKIISVHHKTCLPTYDIFDENRYFEPAFNWQVVEFMGRKIAITICEDIWNLGNNPLYRICPMDILMKQQPDLMINISASPFDYTHDEDRKATIKSNVLKYKIPLFYCNAVGSQTEIVFDGSSLVFDRDGNLCKQFPKFNEHIEGAEVNMDGTIASGIIECVETLPGQLLAPAVLTETLQISQIHDAIVLGIRDYFIKMGFTKAIIGSSGGIDSAVTIAIASTALGKDNVKTVSMPSIFSSSGSVSDARELSERLGNPFSIIPIKNIYDSFLETLNPFFVDLPFNVTEENIQSRIRGNILMALANKFGYILLNTSNKSELATGYGTLYGDMAGGLSVLGDCYKLQIYELAKFINTQQQIIPKNIITKAPSAELKPDQKDTDSLPDYSILDPILYQYIERQQGPDQIKSLGFDTKLVDRILKMVNMNEYKRNQFCPIIRISPKAFGVGRRVPIVGKYLS